jgi:hypothetical protein
MKTSHTGAAKRLAISLLALGALAALSGCAVVPYDSGYYNQATYPGPVVYAPPPAVYVAPMVNFGFGYRSGGGYYGHHYRGGRGRW